MGKCWETMGFWGCPILRQIQVVIFILGARWPMPGLGILVCLCWFWRGIWRRSWLIWTDGKSNVCIFRQVSGSFQLWAILLGWHQIPR
jgi:hypothetical protein